MRDVLDPQSPYAGKYADWDIWLGQHGLRPGDKSVDAFFKGEAPAGWQRFSVVTDEQGFVVPELELLRQQIAQQTSLEAYLAAPHCLHMFEAAGVPEKGMMESKEAAKVALWASVLPRVPESLGQKPPQLVLLLPDGESVCFGRLPAEAGTELTMATYYRLAADGSFRGYLAPGQPWQELFMPGFTEKLLLGASAAECTTVSLNGYTVWLNAETREPQAIYDYDGSSVPLGTDLTKRPGGLIMQMYSDMLLQVYKAQQQGS